VRDHRAADRDLVESGGIGLVEGVFERRAAQETACPAVELLGGGAVDLVLGPLWKRAKLLCAEHVRQLEGESPFHNLMEVK